MAASMCAISSPTPPWLSASSLQTPRSPSVSLCLISGSRTRNNLPINQAANSITCSGLLHCSFLSSPLPFSSSFSGLSLGLDLNSTIGVRKEKGRGLVVRAGKAALCQTKRNRSRKSLARTHGFRQRMRTTSGRAILRRRRAKGRRILCTKSYPNSGKGA